MKRRRSYREALGWTFFGISLIMIANSVRLCFCNDIWYDELFTMGMIEHSYGELIHFTARDVHPPLYYCVTKLIVELCKLFVPVADTVILVKLVSVLPYCLLILYGLCFLRRRFGILVSGMFVFCILSMPQMSAYTVEMRMYSFALFFVTAAFFHAYGIVENTGSDRDADAGRRNTEESGDADAGRRNTEDSGDADAGKRNTEESGDGDAERRNFRRRLHTAAFALYGLAAAYTQYFACVAVIMIYGYLLVVFLIRWRKAPKEKTATDLRNRRDLRNWLLCAVASVAGYLPWLFALISQITQIKENYWILPLTWRNLGGCVKFLLKPAFQTEALNYGFAAILFVLYTGMAAFHGYALFRRKRRQDGAGYGRWVSNEESVSEEERKDSVWPDGQTAGYAAAGFLVLAGVVCFGFLASFLLRPIFVYRYMIPAAGCLWLCLALWLDGLPAGRMAAALQIFAVLVILAVGIRDYRAFWGEERYKAVLMEETGRVMSDIAPEDIIIYNFDQLQAVAGYYLEQESYLWEGTPETLVAEMFGNLGSLSDAGQIREWLAEGRTVWFFGSFNSREDIRLLWEEAGIATEEEGSYLLERYWFNRYALTKSWP